LFRNAPPSIDRRRLAITLVVGISVLFAASALLRAQIETVGGTPRNPTWLSHGRVEGHLALRYSPAGAFSTDGSTLAVAAEDKVVLMDLRDAGIRKVLKPRVGDITDLEIQSANFLDATHLFLLATGLMHSKGKGSGGPTPLLGFQWDTEKDALSGKVNAIAPHGGFGAARYFPHLEYLAMYKDSNFSLWNPATGRGPQLNLPVLNRQPNLYEFSPDGHWLLLAQIESSGTADPVVVRLSEHQFVDSLRGHQGTVLSIAFSRDGKRVVTTCEDGKVRIWSVPEWKLLQTLSGHEGPVHWAEFSSDGKWVASAGEDKTVRIWSAEDGKLEQTLLESQAPVLTVAFSPNDLYLAASAEQTVYVWQQRK
jgi:WD40 repeat protein